MGKVGDPAPARAAARERPIVRSHQIFVRTFHAPNKRGSDLVLAGAYKDR